MFNFLGMTDNRDERMVDRYESDDLIVDTCWVNDADKPYETAVSHTQYNKGNWIIVQDYDDKETAQIGHNIWVLLMTQEDKLPDELTDIHTSGVAQLQALFGEDQFTHKRNE